jgi:hypothetical protein
MLARTLTQASLAAYAEQLDALAPRCGLQQGDEVLLLASGFKMALKWKQHGEAAVPLEEAASHAALSKAPRWLH